MGEEILDVLEHDTEDVDSDDLALEKTKELVSDFYSDELSVWNVVFKTKSGSVVLRHINSSNGYYDGETIYSWVD